MSVDEKIAHSRRLVTDLLDRLDGDGKKVVGIVGLFSGGNDSTTLCHIFRDVVTHYAHANTGIGIEETRQYVRDTCAAWGRPLLEGLPLPNRTYDVMVMGEAKAVSPRAKYPLVWPGGFPGAGAHGTFLRVLKTEWMNAVRNMLVGDRRRERVLFLGGRRIEESARRKTKLRQIGPIRLAGSAVYLDAIHFWSKTDIASYRTLCADCPRNAVADHLHMSGECLCGCYAHPGELEEIRFFKPDVAAEIEDKEKALKERGLDIPPHTLRWGWNGKGRCASGCND